ncbi:MAG: hypothetical protein AAGA81_17690 [Acidobacteriota bacterium]
MQHARAPRLRFTKLRLSPALGALALLCGLPAAAQEEEEGPKPLPADAQLELSPTEITLEVGETAQIDARILSDGAEVEGHTVVFFSRSRRNVGVNAAGRVEAHGPGEFKLIALVPKDPEDSPRRAEPALRAEVTVTIPNPPVELVTIERLPSKLYSGTTLPLTTKVVDTTEVIREDVVVAFTSSAPDIAEPDDFGHLLLKQPGTFSLTAEAEDAKSVVELEVVANPVSTLTLEAPVEEARTGDVVRFSAVARDASGQVVDEIPVQWTTAGSTASGIIAAGASAEVARDGRFVAERSGIYTVSAVAGDHTASRRIKVTPRDVRKEVEFVGQGKVRDRHTSDLWVWEAADGNSYAITGTWGAEGHAYIWDVTSPENITLIDTVRVDARTVNDVKLSEDGKIAVISREGASNRKNGLVILDVSEPQVGVRILARFDDQLKGGVHNVFVHEEHIYAVNNGRRFDIINIEDPTKPYRVGRFELDTPGHAIHDVWVVDGVAFTSNWHDGVWAIDVGGGGKGGAPNNPVALGSYKYPSGWNHAAFPYKSPSTGKFYVFAGDEAFPYGLRGRNSKEATPRAAGWIHVIEWDDWENPVEIARYGVPEAGTHNLWIEDEVLYVAYYNGGLRIVDISGELMGDLYAQGREIGLYMPYDSEGFIPNAPFTWGPQPFKDHIFFSDWNSGLWAVKLRDLDERRRSIGEPQ